MILKLFKSSKDLTNDKLRNPFFGTYIFIWIIRNWELLYSIVFFDKDWTLNQKVKYIEGYFKEREVLHELWTNLWITFLLFLISYLLLNFSRVFVNLSELVLRPKIDNFIDSKSIVRKDKYNRVKDRRDELQNILDKNRDTNSLRESKLDLKRKEIKKLKEINEVHENDIREMEDKITRHDRYKEYDKNGFEEKLELNYDEINALKKIIFLYLNGIIDTSGADKMIKFLELHNENNKIIEPKKINTDTANFFMSYFLIEKKDMNYAFTELGNILRKCIHSNEYEFNKEIYDGINKYIKQK